MKVKQLAVALSFVVGVGIGGTASAQSNSKAERCEGFGKMVSLIQDERNRGLTIEQFSHTLTATALVGGSKSDNPRTQEYIKNLFLFTKVIFDGPVGKMTTEQAKRVGIAYCEKNLD